MARNMAKRITMSIPASPAQSQPFQEIVMLILYVDYGEKTTGGISLSGFGITIRIHLVSPD